ncbi:MAG: hypothetical protein QOE90_1887 [Thermoplasmata archaeon]|jgi:hypothetical protein|nr:hypothetical protein [Thermoplasmata archaeon]
MTDARGVIGQPFLDRVRAPTAWAVVGFRVPRAALAFGLALVPLVIVLLAAWLGPAELAKAITSQKNVQETFARFVTAVATASAIAVSVASLTLNREMKGLHTLRERHEANEAFRARLRKATGRNYAPVTVSGFLAALLQTIAREAREAQAVADETTLALREEDISLGELLALMERRALETAARLDAVRRNPDHVLGAALDFEADVTSHLARRFAREAPTEALREALTSLHEQLADYNVATRYVKTLDTSWGLSNMSWAILVATIPSILTAAFMVLAYGDGAISALGRLGAAALVGAALSVVILPLGFFVSYVLRFVFLNEHTLPTDGFVLGPDADDMVQRRPARRPARVG